VQLKVLWDFYFDVCYGRRHFGVMTSRTRSELRERRRAAGSWRWTSTSGNQSR